MHSCLFPRRMVRSRPTCWRSWKKSAGSRHGASLATQNCSAVFMSEAAKHGKKRSGNSASKTSASRLSAKSARANEVRRGHVRRVQGGRNRTGFGQSNSSPGSLPQRPSGRRGQAPIRVGARRSCSLRSNEPWPQAFVSV